MKNCDAKQVFVVGDVVVGFIVDIAVAAGCCCGFVADVVSLMTRT